MRRAALVVVLALTLAGAPGRSAVAADATCASPEAPLVVGRVACKTVVTHLLGPGIGAPFGYYVPPECSARKCPVLYLLHGFGGDFTEMVGTAAKPSAWVAAEAAAPPAGFESSPWTHADPAGWTAAPHLPIILVAPRGRTLPGGYGPAPDLDSYWADWNPRYAAGGDQQTYATPPPRFESFLLRELAPFVESHFPTGAGRAWRAIGGVSLGGFGAYKDGLQHPDAFTSMLSVSGALNFLFVPWLDPPARAARLLRVALPGLPYTPLPSITKNVPLGSLPPQAGTFLTALLALGDPVADQGAFRGNMPRDLAMNGHNLGIDGFVNDTVPRQQSDVGDVTSQAFENIVFPMNLDQELAFRREHVQHTFAIHQGLHSDDYRNAWFRGMLEYASARFGNARAPRTFEYRTTQRDFSVWGWQFAIDRAAVEFLDLRDVSCRALSLEGSGSVTVTVPDRCGTGLHGRRTFTVNLGPSSPIDDPAGLGSSGHYGRTVTIRLHKIS